MFLILGGAMRDIFARGRAMRDIFCPWTRNALYFCPWARNALRAYVAKTPYFRSTALNR